MGSFLLPLGLVSESISSCAHTCTYVHEHPYTSNVHRRVHLASIRPCTHMYIHTDKTHRAPVVLLAGASFLWDEDDRVQTPPVSTGSPVLPRELVLLPLTPASAGSSALGAGTAASTLGLCCYRASGTPSTGPPPPLPCSLTSLSASAAQAPASLHPRPESSEREMRDTGGGTMSSARLCQEGNSLLLPDHPPSSLR